MSHATQEVVCQDSWKCEVKSLLTADLFRWVQKIDVAINMSVTLGVLSL